MTFAEVLERALEIPRRRRRISHRALQMQFQLDDTRLEIVRDEIVEVHQLTGDREGKMLVWTTNRKNKRPLPPPPGRALPSAPVSGHVLPTALVAPPARRGSPAGSRSKRQVADPLRRRLHGLDKRLRMG